MDAVDLGSVMVTDLPRRRQRKARQRLLPGLFVKEATR
jgi:hypothetical protein